MKHTSRVVISTADISGPICLEVLGCLTLDSVRTVTEILDRGLKLISSPDLRVDLRNMDHIEPVGLAALELYIAERRASAGLSEITATLPSFPRECEQVSV